jgi:hypothetical protein
MFGGEDSLLDLSDHVLDGADPTPVRAQVDIDLDD